MSRFNVSFIVGAKSQDSVHKSQFFEEKGEPKRIEQRSFCSRYTEFILRATHTHKKNIYNTSLPDVALGGPVVDPWTVNQCITAKNTSTTERLYWPDVT